MMQVQCWFPPVRKIIVDWEEREDPVEFVLAPGFECFCDPNCVRVDFALNLGGFYDAVQVVAGANLERYPSLLNN